MPYFSIIFPSFQASKSRIQQNAKRNKFLSLLQNVTKKDLKTIFGRRFIQ